MVTTINQFFFDSRYSNALWGGAPPGPLPLRIRVREIQEEPSVAEKIEAVDTLTDNLEKTNSNS